MKKIKINKKRFLKWFWGIVIAPFALIFILIIGICLGIFGYMPTFEDLENPQNKLATEIISDDGIILGTFHVENRSYVSYEELPRCLVDALVATEDARFYDHSGIDFMSLARVAGRTVLMRDRRGGGGSTISQQLAKNLFPRDTSSSVFGVKHAKLVIAKLKEWVTAVKLERNYTKEEIIAMYLNTVEYGSNAFGIRSATQTFFSKHPSQLTCEEGAVLIGVVNAPSWYSPVRNPERSTLRRNVVMSQMEKYGYMNKAVYDSLKMLPIKLTYAPQSHNSGLATYFREMLKRTLNAKKPDRKNYWLYDDFYADSIQWAENPAYGWCSKNLKPDGKPYNLDRDGLRIYTTIHSKMQQYAEQAVEEHLSKEIQPALSKELKANRRTPPFSNDLKQAEIDKIIQQAMNNSDRTRMMRKAGISQDSITRSFNRKIPMTVFSWNNKNHTIDTVMSPIDSIYYTKSYLRAALVAVEPNTGYVRAYVGGPDFRYFKYDNARQGRRQVGSTIKPFLYTLAMQEGYSPCHKVLNARQHFTLPSGEPWSPETTDKPEYIGKEVTLKWGLTNSSNNISGWLMKQFGPEALANLCRQMGITSYIDLVPSLCLGPSDFSPFEMAGAYNTFASKGIHIDPFFVTRIEDRNGNVLATFVQRKNEAISESTAFLMMNLMQAVVNEGTAYRLRSRYVPQGPIAGKTGTTNGNSDGWFVGYVPKLCTSVWVGGEDRSVHFNSTRLGQGANTALPIWGIFMKNVLNDKSIPVTVDDTFSVPSGMSGLNLNCSGSEQDMDAVTSDPDFF